MDEIVADAVSESEEEIESFDLDIMSESDEDNGLPAVPEPEESQVEPEQTSIDEEIIDNTEDLIAEMATIEESELETATTDEDVEELMASNSEVDGIDLGDPEMKDDALAEMLEEEVGEEEMPDFSLDDFGPEGLDDDASTTDAETGLDEDKP